MLGCPNLAKPLLTLSQATKRQKIRHHHQSPSISMTTKKNQISENQQKKKKTSCIQPPLEYPWLISRRGTKGHICCNTSPLYKGFSKSFPPNLHIETIFNCCFGWLICSAGKNRNLFLWNPLESRLVQLPPSKPTWSEYFKLYDAVLSSPPPSFDGMDDNDPKCMIMLFIGSDLESWTYPDRCYIDYCLLGGREEKHWNSVGLDSNVCFYRDPIVFNGSVYVRDRWELVCLNDVNSIRIIKTSYGPLPKPLHDANHRSLVESCGELFYIYLSWEKSCDQEDWVEISNVEAFRWDSNGFLWNKVTEDLGDRVFFFNGTYSISISSYARGPAEIKGGFLYYITRNSLIRSYCFAGASISTLSLPSLFNIPNRKSSPVLYLPCQRLTDGPAIQINLVETGLYEDVSKRETLKQASDSVEVYDTKVGGVKNSLLICFPEDIIGLILGFLNPVDYLNFRSVSTTCRLLAPQITWREAAINLVNPPPLSPWLMSIDNDSKQYSFLDSRHAGKYCRTIPESVISITFQNHPKSVWQRHVDTPDSTLHIVYSNNGWLLIYMSGHSDCQLSLYNPLIPQIIELPTLACSIGEYSTLGFSWSPMSSKCIVLVIQYSLTFYLVVGCQNWSRLEENRRYGEDENASFEAYGSPVFHDGSFYCLRDIKDGSLAAMETEFDDDDLVSWKTLNITKEHSLDLSSKKSFLVSCHEKLLLVTMDRVGGLIEVFALNQATTISWEKVDDLGDRTLYLCKSAAISTPARDNWMRNIIFFGRFHEDNIVYYSMDTKKYHTLANKDDAVEYHNTRELLFATWIEPSWSLDYPLPNMSFYSRR